MLAYSNLKDNVVTRMPKKKTIRGAYSSSPLDNVIVRTYYDEYA